MVMRSQVTNFTVLHFFISFHPDCFCGSGCAAMSALVSACCTYTMVSAVTRSQSKHKKYTFHRAFLLRDLQIILRPALTSASVTHTTDKRMLASSSSFILRGKNKVFEVITKTEAEYSSWIDDLIRLKTISNIDQKSLPFYSRNNVFCINQYCSIETSRSHNGSSGNPGNKSDTVRVEEGEGEGGDRGGGGGGDRSSARIRQRQFSVHPSVDLTPGILFASDLVDEATLQSSHEHAQSPHTIKLSIYPQKDVLCATNESTGGHNAHQVHQERPPEEWDRQERQCNSKDKPPLMDQHHHHHQQQQQQQQLRKYYDDLDNSASVVQDHEANEGSRNRTNNVSPTSSTSSSSSSSRASHDIWGQSDEILIPSIMHHSSSSSSSSSTKTLTPPDFNTRHPHVDYPPRPASSNKTNFTENDEPFDFLSMDPSSW